MPIQTILQEEYDLVFETDEIAALTAAYHAVLSKLGVGLIEPSHPLRRPLAKLIIQLAEGGERDPEKLCGGALQVLGT